MATLTFDGVGKVFRDGTRAVQGLNLEVLDGELMVLVGPSGCGKTTALRMVAGLEEITEGAIRLNGSVVNAIEPRKRDVAMVFQNYALYPHMTVFDNIAFPLRSRRLPKREIRERVEHTARLLDLTDLLNRKPRTLSGGQRQRVAMGRAITRRPRAFLMDEPLSNLDARLRWQMRAEIAKLQRELAVTTLYVTHDQVEATTLGHRIGVMRKGVLQQEGPPQELYDRPADLFVASFLGAPPMNIVQARLEAESGGICCVVGEQRLPLPSDVVARQPILADYVGRQVAAGIRPEHLGQAVGNENHLSLAAKVLLVETLGSECLVHLEVAAQPVLADSVLELAQDTDAAVVRTLQQQAGSHRHTLVARFDSGSSARIGSRMQVAVSPHLLYFFDLGTGLSLSRAASRSHRGNGALPPSPRRVSHENN